MEFHTDSFESIKDDCFVKLSNQEQWYYIGDECELDATKINSGHSLYSIFKDKRLNDQVILASKYKAISQSYTIEHILSIEKYLLWQSIQHAHRLTSEGRWKVMEQIDIPISGDKVDPQFLIQRLKDDQEIKCPPLSRQYLG